MASVNDLILESNVRERLYPAMPFKILQIYMKTANRYAYASCFSGNIFPKRKRISGPQYISCQKKATGKFMKVVWSHTATNWEPAFLNKIVAIKLMIGHIMQMIITEIATVIAKGLSLGVTIRKASLWARLSTIKNSSTNATGHMIFISPKAMRNTWLLIPPIFREML